MLLAVRPPRLSRPCAPSFTARVTCASTRCPTRARARASWWWRATPPSPARPTPRWPARAPTPRSGPCPRPWATRSPGAVVEAGAGAAWPRPGDAVVVANSAPCGDCPAVPRGARQPLRAIVYLTGAFAERLRVPAPIAARNTLPAARRARARAGARMAEPLACALHTARRAARPGRRRAGAGRRRPGADAGRASLARARRRVHLADPHPDRREPALRFGAERTHEAPRDDAPWRRCGAALPGGAGADLVVEAVGRPETWRDAAVALARPGGDVLLHGGCPPGLRSTLPTRRYALRS